MEQHQVTAAREEPAIIVSDSMSGFAASAWIEAGVLLTPEQVDEILSAAPRGLLESQAELLFPGKGELVLFHWRDSLGEHFKFLRPRQLRLAVSSIVIDSGWLPPGVCRWGVGARDKLWMLKFIPPAVHTLTLTDAEAGPGGVQAPVASRTLTVPLPALVLGGTFTEKLGATYYLWAVKEGRAEELSDATPAYRAPLPNVNGDGLVCFGENSVGEVTAESIEQTWRTFITSPFNRHWANGKSRTADGDIGELLARLAQRRRKRYPLGDLREVPARNGSPVTLGTLIGALLHQQEERR